VVVRGRVGGARPVWASEVANGDRWIVEDQSRGVVDQAAAVVEYGRGVVEPLLGAVVRDPLVALLRPLDVKPERPHKSRRCVGQEVATELAVRGVIAADPTLDEKTEDRTTAIRVALSGIARDLDLGELVERLAPLHPKHDDIPGEVLLELAADAIEEAGETREQPLEFEGIQTPRMAPQRGPYGPLPASTLGRLRAVSMATNSRPLFRCGGVYIIEGSDGTHQDEVAAMPALMKIAVAGATGRVGSRVVELLAAGGHDAVPMSRSTGVDLVTGEGLAEALAGAECVIDAASGTARGRQRRAPNAAREFFTASARNLHEIGQKAGVQRMVEVSVLGIDHFTAGQGAARYAHEKAMLAGPIPVRVLRAALFHEMVPQLIAWGTQGDMAYLRNQRIQPVAARAVAQALVELATDPAWAASPARSEPPFPEIAGPREETLLDLAELFVARRGTSLRIHGVTDPNNPDDKVWEDGSLLPNPQATLAGPTFQAWLDSDDAKATAYGAR
jgi:uncharacterized protein YbjT (DUF2867 family)